MRTNVAQGKQDNSPQYGDGAYDADRAYRHCIGNFAQGIVTRGILLA